MAVDEDLTVGYWPQAVVSVMMMMTSDFGCKKQMSCTEALPPLESKLRGGIVPKRELPPPDESLEPDVTALLPGVHY